MTKEEKMLNIKLITEKLSGNISNNDVDTLANTIESNIASAINSNLDAYTKSSYFFKLKDAAEILSRNNTTGEYVLIYLIKFYKKYNLSQTVLRNIVSQIADDKRRFSDNFLNQLSHLIKEERVENPKGYYGYYLIAADRYLKNLRT